MPALTRALDVHEFTTRASGANGDGVYRLKFAASSAYPVERFFGTEILDHAGVRLDRARRGAMPLLFNHDLNAPRGMVDAASVVGDRILIDAHLFDTADSTELRRMIEGGLRNVSIGYRVNSAEERKDGTTVIRDWEALEVSIVTVPQDPTVGIGRSDQMYEARMIRASGSSITARNAAQGETMEDETATAGVNADNNTSNVSITTRSVETGASGTSASGTNGAGAGSSATGANGTNYALDGERTRQQAIRNIVRGFGLDDDTANRYIQQRISLEAISEHLLAAVAERGRNTPRSLSQLGLSDREANGYSLCRAIIAAHSNDWRQAGFELECHETIARRTDKAQERGRFYVPLEVQRRGMVLSADQLMQVAQRHRVGHMVRDLNVSNAADGGYLVQTTIQGFDEILRNISFAYRMGATRITGLRDNITIPRQNATATAEWLTGETDAPGESQAGFTQLPMSPKTVSAYTELSRRLLLQASLDVEGLVNTDLAAVVALAVDVAVISGSGAAGQPSGIDVTPGVGGVAGAAIALPGIIETQTDLAAGNVMPMRGGYVTTPAVAGLLIQRVMYAGTASPIWVGNVWNGNIMGFPAMSTNQVAAAKMYFGDWSKVVVGEWGTLEIDTSPYANFPAGIIGVRAMYSVDIGVRYPVAFTIMTGIT